MPRTGSRETIERGIYRDATGHEVVARAGSSRRSKRFPLTAKLRALRAWRDSTTSELRDEAAPLPDSSTIAGAIDRYLLRVKPKGDTSQLTAWKTAIGTMQRRKLTAAKCQEIFDRWTADGYSRQTLRVRKFALQRLWRTLDGPAAKTPVDHIKLPKPRLQRPVWVDDETILSVLVELRRHEMAGWIRTAKTRARFLVLATTGQRPAQVKRAERGDIDLERGIWWVRPAKGGDRIPLYFNAEIRAAWQAFIAAKAWGPYNTRSFARTLRSCGWPAGVPPYNVRHATGMTLSARGRDLGDIQQHMGHTSIATTRSFYVPGLLERMQQVSESLEGRFSQEEPGGFRPTPVARVRGTRKNRKKMVGMAGFEPATP